MVFPSRGCQTCRSRRIKCDETRPSCNQCTRSGRKCKGFKTEPGVLPFRSQNEYASGLVEARESRRRSAPPTVSSQPPSAAVVGYERASGSSTTETVSMDLAEVPAPLNVPRELQAFTYFAHKYIEGPDPGTLQLWTFLNRHKLQYEFPDPSSSLGLALGAISFAFFSRTRDVPGAVRSGHLRYVQALSKTKETLSDPQQIITDEALLTVMVLNAYENMTYTYGDKMLPSRGFRHHDGAMALLKIRRDRNGAGGPGQALNTCIRNLMIKSAIMRGNVVPDWLRDGAFSGEEEEEHALSRLLIEVAQLRNEAKDLMKRATEAPLSDKPAFMPQMIELVATAQELDAKLVSWSKSLPADWTYTIYYQVGSSTSNSYTRGDGNSYDGRAHVYPGTRYAVGWNTYRGARLITTGIVVRTGAHPLLAEDDELQSQRSLATLNQHMLLNDICASIPYHLGRVPTSSPAQREPDQHTTDDQSQVKAKDGMHLLWPLVIASAVSTVPEDQLRWIKRQMHVVSQITGSGILDSVSKETTADHPDPSIYVYPASQK